MEHHQQKVSKFTLFLILSTLLIIGMAAQANKSYWGHAKERGIVVELDTDKQLYQAGENVTVSGKIKLVNRSSSGSSSSHNKGSKKSTLLEEFDSNGYAVVVTYPNDLTVISNNFDPSQSDDDEIKFQYQVSANVNFEKPQISVKVYNNKNEIFKLQKFTKLREKFQKRLQALSNYLDDCKRKNFSQSAIEHLSKKIAKLTNIIATLSSKINSDENLIAENSKSILIKNQQSGLNRLSTIMNRYRFLIENSPGTVIQGQKVTIAASIKNLRTSNGESEDNDDEFDGYKVADFKLNGQYLYTSPKKIMKPNDVISFEREISQLIVGENTFTIELWTFENNVRKSKIGSLTQKIFVLADNVAPIWLTSSVPAHGSLMYLQNFPQVTLLASDSLGSINTESFSFKLASVIGGQSLIQDITSEFSKVSMGQGESAQFKYNSSQISSEGPYSFSAVVKDQANNSATPNPYTGQFIIDRTSPVIAFDIENGHLTNSNNLTINTTIIDSTPVQSKLFVNGVELAVSTLKNFLSTILLTNEGRNYISVFSEDAAGNPVGIKTIEVFKDTFPPMITNILPANNSNIYQMQFVVSGESNEALKEVKVNGYQAEISSDKKSFTFNYVAEEQGQVAIQVTATDLAGNSSNYTQNLDIRNKLLNADLVMIFPTPDNLRLRIIGQSYASRPGAKIAVNTGFLGLVSANTTSSNFDGSFELEIDLFESAIIKATDLSTGQVEQANLFFDKTKTKISGIIKDSFNNPLPGATVRISGSSQSVLSDATGVFTILNPPSGDQTLIIDGSTVPQSVTGADRRFFTTRVSVSIGLGQNNVVERAIYLTPLLFDNSETLVNPNTQTVVSSIHAPGVELLVPAQTAIFPSGEATGAINVMKIDADFSVIPVPEFAVPENVYVFEPSGLSFKQRVQMTLPNDNELPAGVELLIYSMNSAKGAWEIDGLAQVSPDGSKVITKPGHGISHFSPVYAVPVSPLMMEAKNPKLSGVDISQGSLTAAIQMPSFKSLGEVVTPTLQYKSSWANPTAVTTNTLSFPEQRSEFGGTFIGNKFEYQTYQKRYCVRQNPETRLCEEIGERPEQFLLGLETTFTGNITSWYEPERVRAQFFVSDIATNPDDLDFYYTPNNANQLGNANFKTVISSKIASYRGKEFNQKVPVSSQLSYAVPLFNPNTNQYLKSGIYPTLSRYEITLKNMKLLTGLAATRVTVNGSGAGFNIIRTVLDNKLESQIMKEAMPKDVVSTALVQSKVDSSFGRGWNISGVQKIVNPDGGRIMVENEDGSVATYALNNTISTVANLNDTNVDLGSMNISTCVSHTNKFSELNTTLLLRI